MPLEFLEAHVLADRHVSQEMEPLVGGDALVDPDHPLQLLVVGSDPGANQPIGGGKTVEHVQVDFPVRLEKSFGRKEPGGAAPHDGHPERSCLGTKLGHAVS